MKKEKRSISDIIKYDGIKSKGFGTIPKFIMHDTELTLESKAIYGYFSSLCGNGTETFPARATILSALKLSKTGYYNHYNALKEQGYIEVSKADPSNIKSCNVYTIISNPKKLTEFSKTIDDDRRAKLISDGIDSYGYGILPKTVMADDRLDIKAKGLYCYLASYAGAGKTVYPEKKNMLHHLQIAEGTYYKYYNQLVDLNYITPVQRKIVGRFSVCDYILNQYPDERIGAITQEQRHKKKKPPYIKNEDISKHGVNSDFLSSTNIKKENNVPYIKNRDITTPYIKKQDIAGKDIIYNSTSINKFSTNSDKINQSIRQEKKEYRKERMNDFNSGIQNTKDEEEIRQIIKDNDGIPYTFLSNTELITDTVHILTGWNDYAEYRKSKNFENLNNELFSLANHCLIEMLTCEYDTYKGARVSNNQIRERINEVIEFFDNDDNFSFDVSINTFLDSFLDEYKKTAEYHEIKFPVKHMKTCLFKFFTEFKFKYSVMINDASRTASGADSIYQRRFRSNKS